MSVALPISTDPSALSTQPQRLNRWRRLPFKAKAGVILLGFFVLVAIIGPMVAP